MNRKTASIFSVLIIVAFIGYIIFDSIKPEGHSSEDKTVRLTDSIPEPWKISGRLQIKEGTLKAVAVSSAGNIIAGGDSFVSCYNNDHDLLWSLKTDWPVTSLSVCGDTILASTMELILVISAGGRLRDEWGPFEDKAIITSVASNGSSVAFSDAANKIVVILDRKGTVKKLIGENDGQFIIPSAYFDVALDRNNRLFVANTGHRRIETRTEEGQLVSSFGEPGSAPGAFCGCCNPAHFIAVPRGFVTSEKGINRIKVLGKGGEFIEYVSSKNKFLPSIPLDLASADGNTIYAANPADSRIYIFSRTSEQAP
jgi:hypothetical protein